MIARVRLATYAVPLDPAWPSAEGPVATREGALLVLEEDRDRGGHVGFGESAPFPGFGLETFASSVASLRLAAKYLVGLPRERYAAAIADLHRLAPVAACPCARHAIDLALHDLLARGSGVPIARMLGGDGALREVAVNAAIPRLSAAETARAAREAAERGYGTIKIKVGGAAPAEDVGRVRAAREEIGPHVRIRVDANQAWSEAEAIAALRAMEPLGVELCEQPAPVGAIESMARVRAATAIPIAADESVIDAAGARRLLEARAADVIVVKPMVLGGLYAARAVAALAQEFGAGVIVTSLLEGEVGRAGALHFAASLGRGRHAHGVATGVSLAGVVDAGRLEGGMLPVARANITEHWFRKLPFVVEELASIGEAA
ncbi:MAG TPA: enolase C-terminal domain-like protein [Candidatus Eisenbacteria bacterium]|nr:enolase C-terminal domain-like protein [Candidatus Eisenbacteria bacterium]